MCVWVKVKRERIPEITGMSDGDAKEVSDENQREIRWQPNGLHKKGSTENRWQY